MQDNCIQLDGISWVKGGFTLSLTFMFLYPIAILIKFSVFKMAIACKNIWEALCLLSIVVCGL